MMKWRSGKEVWRKYHDNKTMCMIVSHSSIVINHVTMTLCITLAKLIYPRFLIRFNNPRKLSPSSGIEAALLELVETGKRLSTSCKAMRRA